MAPRVPEAVGDVSKLPNLIAALKAAGYSEDLPAEAESSELAARLAADLGQLGIPNATTPGQRRICRGETWLALDMRKHKGVSASRSHPLFTGAPRYGMVCARLDESKHDMKAMATSGFGVTRSFLM